MEQVWQGGRICRRAILEINGLECRTVAGKQGSGRHCRHLRELKMVHSGKGKRRHPASPWLRSQETERAGRKQKWAASGVNVPAFSRRLFHRQLLDTVLPAKQMAGAGPYGISGTRRSHRFEIISSLLLIRCLNSLSSLLDKNKIILNRQTLHRKHFPSSHSCLPCSPRISPLPQSP